MTPRHNVGDILSWPAGGDATAIVVCVVDGGGAGRDTVAVNAPNSYVDMRPPENTYLVARVDPPYDPPERAYAAGEYVVYCRHPKTEAGRVVDVLDGGSTYLVQAAYGETFSMGRAHIRRVATEHEKRRFIIRFNDAIDSRILMWAKFIEDCESHRIREW
jgi:hypothetical protein